MDIFLVVGRVSTVRSVDARLLHVSFTFDGAHVKRVHHASLVTGGWKVNQGGLSLGRSVVRSPGHLVSEVGPFGWLRYRSGTGTIDSSAAGTPHAQLP